MKIAPLMEAYKAWPQLQPLIVHTGQHYDENMSKIFFDALGIPKPDLNLEVGSGSHAAQTAAVMQRFEPVVLDHKPDLVLVVGDVNSTAACAMVAAKLCVPVAHVEAGLRSFDRTMPEEINRVVTDTLSDLLLVTEPSGLQNLKNEGIADAKCHLVGNVMIDTLLRHRDKAADSDILERLGLAERAYAAMTLHRPSNVDDPATFGRILDALEVICADMPIIFPCHPRTRKNLAALGLQPRLNAVPELRLLEPLGYLDFLRLMDRSRLVLTDSGGIQEETTILGVPCLTIRENTERPVTIEVGTNQLVGTDTARILAGYEKIKTGRITGRRPDLWDGQAAQRIARILAAWSR
jgi:UDP-N-acetylglucosamine 2-epimerase (non-hydrolysing)